MTAGLRPIRLQCLLALLLAAAVHAGNLPSKSPASPAVADPDEHVVIAALLEGVKSIDAPGVPGPLASFGARSFPIIAAKAGKNAQAPVAVAATWESGRVVALGHNGYFDPKSLAVGDSAAFLLNAIRWCGERPGKKGGADLRVGAWGNSRLATFLRERGLKAEVVSNNPSPEQLAACSVICANVHDLSEPRVNRMVADFVRRGGGLVAGGLGWGWLQLNPGKALAEHPGNRLLAPAGILWLDGSLSRTAPQGFSTANRPGPLCQATRALERLKIAGTNPLPPAEAADASWCLIHIGAALPAGDRGFRPSLDEFVHDHSTAMPTAAKPLKSGDVVARLAVALQFEKLKTAPPPAVTADPSAATFPGIVPASAARISRSISIDTQIPGWHSTGLYAPPGEVITVKLAAAPAKGSLSLRIGAHSDRLWDLEVWKRCPEITLHKPLLEAQTQAASPFGGLIYIEVSKASGAVEVTLSGGVEAPYFQLGRTTSEAWKKAQQAPAPWAELATSKVILTVPSELIRKLDDPTPLLQHWDRVLDCCADLAGTPHERARPERYVPDVQISAGYMHSGYPIMTHMDSAPMLVDLARLTHDGDAWGFYHEMGHNHQSSDWTFEGTTEVTVNLFSLYVIRQLNNCLPTRGHPAISEKAQAKTRKAYLAGGRNFETWKKEPFLALQMYIELIDGFGWDVIKKVIAEYRTLPADQRPRSDQDKRDQWLARCSRISGRNLGPFFDSWGVPVSTDAKKSVAALPAWMPQRSE